MKISIGTKNNVKVEALSEILKDYPHLAESEVVSLNIPSDVSEQPKTLDETVKGAINRARGAYTDVAYSFGIESGLMKVPKTKTGHMDVTVCAIFDGEEFHLGLSSGWETPKEVAKYMLEDGLDMNDAAHKAGLTTNVKIGSAEGLVGIMTKGRLTRKDYTKEAIRTALIHIEA